MNKMNIYKKIIFYTKLRIISDFLIIPIISIIFLRIFSRVRYKVNFERENMISFVFRYTVLLFRYIALFFFIFNGQESVKRLHDKSKYITTYMATYFFLRSVRIIYDKNSTTPANVSFENDKSISERIKKKRKLEMNLLLLLSFFFCGNFS